MALHPVVEMARMEETTGGEVLHSVRTDQCLPVPVPLVAIKK